MATGGVDDGYLYEEEYITNARGIKQFTCRWLPKHSPKAVVFICHGYAVECSITMRGTGVHLVQAGYAVYGIDYVGHGKSDGIQGYIPSFEDLVGDCYAFFTSIAERPENRHKTRFLLGESMGGAVALFLQWKAPPGFWNGAVLVAPMCKIADDLKPNPLVINVLKAMSGIIPTWPIVPTNDVIDLANKEPEIRAEIRANKYCYKGKPRLKTAYEMLMATERIEKSLKEVTIPFLIVHGEADRVTDPAVSKLLFTTASSADKELKLYQGMWHALTSGEPRENIDLVFRDIVAWLDERAVAAHRRTEEELKAKQDAWPNKE